MAGLLDDVEMPPAARPVARREYGLLDPLQGLLDDLRYAPVGASSLPQEVRSAGPTADTVRSVEEAAPALRAALAPALMGMLAGPRGAPIAHRRAVRMEAEGATPRQIFDRTLGFRGPDRNFRFELDDSNMVLTPNARRPGTYRAEDVVDYPNLYRRYPGLNELPVEVVPGANIEHNGTRVGGLSYPGQRIVIPAGDRDLRRAVGHEFNHEIAHREGFSPGSSMQNRDAMHRTMLAIENARTVHRIRNRPVFEAYEAFAAPLRNQGMDEMAITAKMQREAPELFARRLAADNAWAARETDLLSRGGIGYRSAAEEMLARIVEERMGWVGRDRRVGPWLSDEVTNTQRDAPLWDPRFPDVDLPPWNPMTRRRPY